MPIHRYEGIAPDGTRQTGEIEAESSSVADERLRALGFRDVAILASGTDAPGRGDSLAFTEHVASLTASGLPLPEGLRALAAEVGSRQLRQALTLAASRIEQGATLADLYKEQGNAMPLHLSRILDDAAHRGIVASVLTEYVRHRSLSQELQRRCTAAAIYPLSLLATLFLLIWFVSRVLAPVFTDVFNTGAQLGISVGRPEEPVVMIVLRFLADNGSSLLWSTMAAGLFMYIYWRFLLTPPTRRRVVLAVPLTGPILRYASLAEFCNLLAMLVEARSPLPLAIELAGGAGGDADLAQTTAIVGRELESGRSLLEIPRAVAGLTSGLVIWIDWASRNNRLPASLRIAAAIFESRARSQASFAAYAFIVLVGILIVWGLLFLFACVIYPMLHMLRLFSL